MKKRIISVLLIAVLLCGAVMGSMISSHAAELYGDVDGDDDVTIIDVTMIQRHLAGVIRLDEAAQRRGDVDADEDMTVIDPAVSLRHHRQIPRRRNAADTRADHRTDSGSYRSADTSAYRS